MKTDYVISPALQLALTHAGDAQAEYRRVQEALDAAGQQQDSIEGQIRKAEAELSDQEAAAALDEVASTSGATRKTLARLRAELEVLPARLSGLRARRTAAGEAILSAAVALESARREFTLEMINAYQNQFDSAAAAFKSVLECGHALFAALGESTESLQRTKISYPNPWHSMNLVVEIEKYGPKWRENASAVAISEALSPVRSFAANLDREASAIRIKATIPPVPIAPSVVISKPSDERPEDSAPARTVAPEGMCRKCGVEHGDESCEDARSRGPRVTVTAAA